MTIDPLLESALDSGYFSSDNNDYEQYFVERWAEIEQLTATCMATEGFEYVPAQSTFFAFGSRPPSGLLIGPRADTAEDGYGIVAGILETSKVPRPVNPNIAITESLSSTAERADYQRALSGNAAAEATRPDPPDAAAASCKGKAEADVWGRDEEVRVAFGQTVTDLQNRISGDERIVSLEKQWASCMRELGHEFGSPQEIQPAITRLVFAAPRPLLESGNDAYADAWEIELAQVIEQEKAIASDDAACIEPLRDDFNATVEEYYEDQFGSRGGEFVELYVPQ